MSILTKCLTCEATSKINFTLIIHIVPIVKDRRTRFLRRRFCPNCWRKIRHKDYKVVCSDNSYALVKDSNVRLPENEKNGLGRPRLMPSVRELS